MKKCNVCLTEKASDEFYKGNAKCKECYKEKVRKHRAEKAEHYRQYDKARANLPHRIEARANYRKTDAGKKLTIEQLRRIERSSALNTRPEPWWETPSGMGE